MSKNSISTQICLINIKEHQHWIINLLAKMIFCYFASPKIGQNDILLLSQTISFFLFLSLYPIYSLSLSLSLLLFVLVNSLFPMMQESSSETDNLNHSGETETWKQHEIKLIANLATLLMTQSALTR